MDHALHLSNLCWICVCVWCRKCIEGELLRFFCNKSVSITSISHFSVHSFKDQWNVEDKKISPKAKWLWNAKAFQSPNGSGFICVILQELLARFHSFSPYTVNRLSMETLADTRRALSLCCWNLKLSHFARWIVTFTTHFKQCHSILKRYMIIDIRLVWIVE